ncbi:MAG TPA: carboxypeptidase-like regulatory domain-containing protein [Terracidiphilus sp.]|nr:carboxypeptidase-like regulatory domain-containing protein [Terracidiphilus sp.]
MKLKMTVFAFIVLLGSGRLAIGQADQGTITGVIQNPSGAVVPSATITLTSVDTGQVLKAKSDGSGVYVFPPVRIGNYKITASAPGFGTTTVINLHLSLQQHLNVVVPLKPGTAPETISMAATASQMQTQESSISQVTNAQSINKVPLSGGNWVYIAQLSAGAAPSQGTHGAGTGDFNSSGQRAEQNNYILDGVDNTNHLVDLGTGASFVAQPPPGGLAEFSVQSGNYSAEFGHSAGAIINASLNSGTNEMHGGAWEYLRNTALDARDWNATSVPPYHENLFGATLGLPIIRNKLFFFGDVQANRIAYHQTIITTVPSLRERTGDFSELLNPALTGASGPIQLYHQSSVGAPQPFPDNNLTSGISGVRPNATALAILNMLPQPNTNGGLLYNNYLFGSPSSDDTTQWDVRLDWNIGTKDTASSAFSYWHEPSFQAPTFGILDGGGGVNNNLSGSFMLSETHVFTPTLTNESRMGFNYIHAQKLQFDATNTGFAASLGFGGIPGGLLNGGLPEVTFKGEASITANFGGGGYSPANEKQNVYQFLDNVTKIVSNHDLKAGANIQSIRFSTLQPVASRGTFTYNGEYTSDLNAPNTGFAPADFLLDSQNSAVLSSEFVSGQARWYGAAYFQDDWRITKKITVNAGLRWEYFQPYKDVGGYQASYHLTGPSSLNTTTGYGSGSAVFEIPSQAESYVQSIFAQTSNAFPNVLAQDNIALKYDDDQHLLTAQRSNFGPRLGIAYSPDANTVIRAGYGFFYGGLESAGYLPNLGQNYPFQYDSTFLSQSCSATSCPTDGITISNGFSTVLANGLANDISDLTLRGATATVTTPYTEDYNLSIQRDLAQGIFATISYVGDSSHHLGSLIDPNSPLALENPSNSAQNARPLPDFGSTEYTSHIASSNYNGLQAKVQKQYSHGNSLLATYTWSHSLDDAPAMMLAPGDAAYRQTNLIPIKMDYSNSAFDTRQRFTFNALYDLPFGSGRKFLNDKGVLNDLVGGWSTNTTFATQTGNPFSVNPTAIRLTSGGYAAGAVKIKNPYASGGTFTSPDPNIRVACAAQTRNRNNWYNPCSFENPWNPNDWAYEPGHYIPTGTSDPHYATASQPVYVTSLASALGFLGGKRNDVYGPGYERINMSVFKTFNVPREQTVQFRTDIFNLFNTPSLGQPSDMTIDSTGGKITGPRSFQKLTPDARFIQLSLKYAF